VDADQDSGPRATGRADAEIAPPGLLRDRALDGEEVVLDVEAVGRKHGDSPQEEAVDLFRRLAYRGSRSDHLWSDRRVVELPRRGLVDRRLVQTDERPKRPADQV